jgi:hypothetical protein
MTRISASRSESAETRRAARHCLCFTSRFFLTLSAHKNFWLVYYSRRFVFSSFSLISKAFNQYLD